MTMTQQHSSANSVSKERTLNRVYITHSDVPRGTAGRAQPTAQIFFNVLTGWKRILFHICMLILYGYLGI